MLQIIMFPQQRDEPAERCHHGFILLYMHADSMFGAKLKAVS